MQLGTIVTNTSERIIIIDSIVLLTLLYCFRQKFHYDLCICIYIYSSALLK